AAPFCNARLALCGARARFNLVALPLSQGWSEVVRYFWLTPALADFKTVIRLKNDQIIPSFRIYSRREHLAPAISRITDAPLLHSSANVGAPSTGSTARTVSPTARCSSPGHGSVSSRTRIGALSPGTGARLWRAPGPWISRSCAWLCTAHCAYSASCTYCGGPQSARSPPLLHIPGFSLCRCNPRRRSPYFPFHATVCRPG